MASTNADPEGQWRARARTFSEHRIRPLVEGIDRSDKFPPELRNDLAKEGFLGLSAPTEWGGAGADTRTTAAVLEEISRASPAVATMVAVQLSVVEGPLARWGSDAQKERFLRPLAEGRFLGAFALTEPGGGSDAARLACRYARADGGFVLDGSKTFITHASSADVAIVFATRDPGAGTSGVAAFLVPKGTPGAVPERSFDKLGLRGSETSGIVLESARVAADLLLGPEGKGLSIALEALTAGRVGIAACALGVGRAAYEELERVAHRHPGDENRTRLAESYVELLAAESLVARAAQARDTGEPFVREASAAKLLASNVAMRIAGRALEATDPSEARAAERIWRDARVFPIVEGPSEIQELILGRLLLGEASEGRLSTVSAPLA